MIALCEGLRHSLRSYLVETGNGRTCGANVECSGSDIDIFVGPSLVAVDGDADQPETGRSLDKSNGMICKHHQFLCQHLWCSRFWLLPTLL